MSDPTPLQKPTKARDAIVVFEGEELDVTIAVIEDFIEKNRASGATNVKTWVRDCRVIVHKLRREKQP